MTTKAKKIVQQAWHITQNNKKLSKYGFIPSFIGILVGSVYIAYQTNAFAHSHTFGGESNYGEIFRVAKNIYANYTNLSIGVIITAIIVGLSYLIVPLICSGALYHMIAQIYREEKPRQGLGTGLLRLLPLIEVGAIKSTVKPASLFSEWSFLVRNVSRDAAQLFFPFLLFFFFIGIIIHYLFIFAAPFVVLNKNSFGTGISNSAKLVIKNAGDTLALFMIFLLIELRVLLNVLLILFLPVAMIAVTGFFSIILLEETGAIVAAIVAFILICITAYITGSLSVFSHAIWTIAFLEFSKGEDELD